MIQPANLAGRLLKLEQQLKAYQKLHEDELAELWRVLNECKQTVVALEEYINEPIPAKMGNSEWKLNRQEQGALPEN